MISARPQPSAWWERWLWVLPVATGLLFSASIHRWFAVGGWLVVLALIAGRGIHRRRRPTHVLEVSVDAEGITRTDGESRRWTWPDLARVDGQEFAPNLTLHPRVGESVHLFPWPAGHDEATDGVCEAVLARAAASGVNTAQTPLVMWRPEYREIDWDQAIVPPSRWSRRRSSAP